MGSVNESFFIVALDGMQNIYYNSMEHIFYINWGVICIVRNSVRLSRMGKKLTQEELAERIGVTRQTIGLIEKEKYNPTIFLCLKLSQVLGESLEQLFWLEEDLHEK